MACATYDITIKRGGTQPIAWRFSSGGVVYDLTGAQAILVIATPARGELLRKDTFEDANFVIDVGGGTVTWTPTPAESRLVPVGSVAGYELELRVGVNQWPLAMGAMIGCGGLNND